MSHCAPFRTMVGENKAPGSSQEASNRSGGGVVEHRAKAEGEVGREKQARREGEVDKTGYGRQMKTADCTQGCGLVLSFASRVPSTVSDVTLTSYMGMLSKWKAFHEVIIIIIIFSFEGY